ncbi:E3 ubiquitin-protein ligase SINA-like 10 [Miscanthus floridulus]|uniref:E3 ubiquitin-protein ligase SINA-like 10 n=1 Tax=Miscanthus floridulus TaxID=154761 RepID=UPI00345A89FA
MAIEEVEFEVDEEVMDEDEDNVEDSEDDDEDEVDVDVDDEDMEVESDNDYGKVRGRALAMRRRQWRSVQFDEDLGSDSIHEHEEDSHEQASAGFWRVRTRTAVANVTVCDADALECGVCFLTLRPPIFQLEATGNGVCHVCGVATRGYRRCHAMENHVDCIRIPCPYAAHGCDATPPYHGQESHRQVCPHAPCHCPGESCGFMGSTAELLDHFAGTHYWRTDFITMSQFGISLDIFLPLGLKVPVQRSSTGQGSLVPAGITNRD